MPFLRTCILHPLERQPGALVCSQPGLPIEARTLGDAIEAAAKYFDVRIVPHDPPRWFRVYGVPVQTPNSAGGYELVDIHVMREGRDISPRQDLSFTLRDTDGVNIGLLFA